MLVLKKSRLIWSFVVLIYSIWFSVVAAHYTSGDVVGYSKYYELVGDVIYYDQSVGFFSKIADVLELQKSWLNSREPVYGLLVYFFASFLDYPEYQIISIALFVAGTVSFLRQVVAMPWMYIHGTLLSSYAVIIAVPAERLRWAAIIFFWLACLVPRQRNYLWPSALSLLSHIQVGITGFAAHYVCQNFKISNLLKALLTISIVGGIMLGQIQEKIVNREIAETVLLSAILGIGMLSMIFLLLESPHARIVVLPFFIYGLLFTFSRINLSIWLLFLFIFDFNSVKVRLVYLALSAFLTYRMVEIISKIWEYGTAF